MSEKRKKAVFLVVIIIIVAAAVLAGFVISGLFGRRAEEEPVSSASSVSVLSVSSSSAEQDTTRKEPGDIIYYNGDAYRYNDHISSFLFMGIDHSSEYETVIGDSRGGQADVLYLVAWDRAEDTCTVIMIPRDTMTEIESLGGDGESLGKSINHICLAYTFGDGKHTSCRLEKDAVSNLFYNIPIQSYCAVKLDCIETLAGLIGDLTVTVPNDSLTFRYPEYTEGTEIVLTPKNTEMFIRTRDISVPFSAEARAERQDVYLQAFRKAAKKKASQDIGFLTDIYTSLQPYMVTNMGTDQFVKILSSMLYGSRETVRLAGESVEGARHDEFYTDDDALYDLIIKTYYKQVKD